MYQVLLVDDEEPILELLRCSVSWEKYNLHVFDAVSSGAEALRIVRQHDIHIVITDIRMSQLNGLELCQQLQLLKRNIQTIIISGYAEFSYAQKAINYGVVGYCLKPVERDDLVRHLVHAVQRLKEAECFPDTDRLLDALEDGGAKDIAKALEGFSLRGEQYYAAVTVGADKLELPPKEGVCVVLGRRQYAYIALNRIPDAQVRAFAADPRSRGYSATEAPVPVDELSAVIKGLSLSALHFFVDGSRKIFPPHEEDQAGPLLQKLRCAAMVHNREKMAELLIECRDCPPGFFSVASALRLYFLVTDSLIADAGEESELLTPGQLTARYRSFAAMLDELIRKLREDAPPPENEAVANSVIMQILVYINAHYHQELSLGRLADIFHMNANYLCQVFHKETGKPFARYVSELRIDKAKELLDSEDTSISDIAAQVGYADYFYFLKTFKRIAGVTPKQYRLSIVHSEISKQDEEHIKYEHDNHA